MLRALLLACLAAAGLPLTPATASVQSPQSPQTPRSRPNPLGAQRPSAETYRAWAEFIRPTESERSYERIGWRNTFWPAVEEARALGRPILLWTMNGHPLGCT
ncbi:MAG: hypothetical protein R3F49_15650 [Planctomycetota bacterium]